MSLWLPVTPTMSTPVGKCPTPFPMILHRSELPAAILTPTVLRSDDTLPATAIA
eukprot:COSAG04_NODE_794_length_10264_cov_35.102804_17_plen_54_part_00